MRRPSSRAAEKSALRRTRRADPKRRRPCGASDNGETLAALGATSGEHFAATAGGIAGAEPNLAGALLLMRTIGRLHGVKEKRGGSWPAGFAGVKPCAEASDGKQVRGKKASRRRTVAPFDETKTSRRKAVGSPALLRLQLHLRGRETVGDSAERDRAGLAGLRAEDNQREAVEGLALAGLERLEADRVAVVDRGDLGRALDGELHQVVRTRHELAVAVGDGDGHEAQVGAVGAERGAVGREEQLRRCAGRALHGGSPGLAGLVGLKDLVRLYLFNTSVSEEGIAKLRAQMPQLRVKWKRAVPTRPEYTLADLVDLSIKAAPPEDSGSGSNIATDSRSSADAKPTANPMQRPMQESIANPETVLSQDDFWDIIDLFNWDEEGNDDAVIAPAVQQLSQLSKEEILAFQEILSEKLYMIDGEKYAREIGRDCFKGNIKQFSKDWFLAVRCCAVANGQLFYNDVLLDASSIPKDLGFAALTTLAQSAYCRKTGESFNYKTKYSIDSCSNQKGWPSLHG